MVPVEAKACLQVVRLIGLGGAVVVVRRLLRRRDEVLIGRWHHRLVEPELGILVRAVRVHEPVPRDDVAGERIANDATRTQRIRPRRQRVEDLVLMVAGGSVGAGARRQQQEIREIAFEVFPVRRKRGRAGEAPRRRVVRHRVIGKEERLAAAVDDLRNHERAAERERADVLATGDLFTTDLYPLIDREHDGGSVDGYIRALNNILAITVPSNVNEGGTMVIPGHGRLSDEQDVIEYRDMLTIVRDRIREYVKRGMTLDEVKAKRPTLDFDPRYGSDKGPWTTAMFVEEIYRQMLAANPPAKTAKPAPQKRGSK